MQTTQLKQFHFSEELHRTLVQTLATSFGLDFLLANDKVGSDVDTIHNVRKGIWATETEQKRYENREDYSSHDYHSDANYIAKNKETSELLKKGKLIDEYRGILMSPNEKKDLDHVIAAKTIHHDPGRVLAEISGVALANQDTNLVATARSINRSKQADSVDEFLMKAPEKLQKKYQQRSNLYNEMDNVLNEQMDMIMDDIDRVSSMSFEEQITYFDSEEFKKNEANYDKKSKALNKNLENLEKKIENANEYIEAFEDIDPEAMKKCDEIARKAYNQKINSVYYKSTKFFKNTALAAGREGFMMGTRQAIGLLLTEVWFELKEQIPTIYQRCRENFSFERFLADVKNVINHIWERVKIRFNDMLTAFKDGAIGGVMSNINKTVLNIFSTTGKLISKLLREVWGSLIKAVKLVFFNPNKLPLGDLSREVTRLLSTAVAVGTGAMVSTHLESLWSMGATFPLLSDFSSEIAGFIGALTTGILTIGFTYFLDHSPLMQKVWDFLNSAKSQSQLTLEYYQKINAELDRYLMELSKIEFNLNADELSIFATELSSINDEYKLSLVLGEEIKRREIDLPFEFGNTNSMRDFLKSKCKKN